MESAYDEERVHAMITRRTFVRLGTTAIIAGSMGAGLIACSTEEETQVDNDGNSDDSSAEENESSTIKEVVDFTGTTVSVNTASTALATLAGPAYEKVFMLGEADRIVATMNGGSYTNAWANLLNPNLSSLFAVSSPRDPNVEELLAQNIEVVFHFNNPEAIEKMTAVGLTALAMLPDTDSQADDVEGFIANLKREVMMYGEALGVEEKAQEWCDFFDEKYDYVQTRLADLSDEDRPSVHIVGGSSILGCFVDKSYPDFYVEMAGGTLVTGDTSEGTFTMEQMYIWDPDIIFMGRQTTKEVITEEPEWQQLTAVQEGNVYITPNGVFYWDYDSEGILLVLYMAQVMHPDLFEDLDMASEIAYYYKNFYGYELSDDQVQRILLHQDPA